MKIEYKVAPVVLDSQSYRISIHTEDNDGCADVLSGGVVFSGPSRKRTG